MLYEPQKHNIQEVIAGIFIKLLVSSNNKFKQDQ